ncbi:hypothetical protein ABVT39_014791 [Epinephelus coioides]
MNTSVGVLAALRPSKEAFILRHGDDNKTGLDIIDICPEAVDMVLVHLRSVFPVMAREDEGEVIAPGNPQHHQTGIMTLTEFIHQAQSDNTGDQGMNERVANISVTVGPIRP